MIVLGGAVALGAAVEACGGETVPTAVPVYGAPASVEDAGTSAPIVPSSASSPTSVTSPPAPSSTAATATPSTSTMLEQAAAQPGPAGTSSPSAAMANGYGGPPHTPNVVGTSTPPSPPKKK